MAVWSMLWSGSTLVNQWMFSLMVIRGLVWVGSGDKLHARDYQAMPHPVLGLQAGRHWFRHTDTTLKSIREVKGEINTWEMRLYYYRYVGRSFSTTCTEKQMQMLLRQSWRITANTTYNTQISVLGRPDGYKAGMLSDETHCAKVTNNLLSQNLKSFSRPLTLTSA